MKKIGIDSTPNAWYLPGDLVWDILVHVPTKSLMRFKFVSKLWYSIIRNLDFGQNHSLYNGCFRGMLITALDYVYNNVDQPCSLLRVFYGNLNANNFDKCTKLKYYEHATLDLRDFRGVTSVVKGLIGLYNDDYFTLCNISTKEMVKLHSNPLSKFYKGSNYVLGYDLVKDVYKVLKSDGNYVYGTDSGIKTEIFTVGRDSDLTWRDIDLPSFESDSQSLCTNGTLYWLAWDTPEPLVAFDLNSERYECIALPTDAEVAGATLADIDGSPAILCLDTDEHDIEIWRMEKDGGGKFEGWTKKTYRLPVDSLVYGGTLPTGEMLLITQSFLEEYPMRIFKYDYIKNEMNWIELDVPSKFQNNCVFDHRSLQIWYHEENIIPLAPLFINQTTETTDSSSPS